MLSIESASLKRHLLKEGSQWSRQHFSFDWKPKPGKRKK